MTDPRHTVVAFDAHHLSGPDWRFLVRDGAATVGPREGYATRETAQAVASVLNAADELLRRVRAFRATGNAPERAEAHGFSRQ